MPYFESEKLFFIHIPKTGGTSIIDYFIRKHRVTLDTNVIYHRYQTHKIENEVEHYNTLWKTQINQRIDAEKQKRFSMNRSNKMLQTVPNDKDWVQVKRGLPDFQTFRKLRLVRNLKHSLHHFTWNEIWNNRDILWPCGSVVKNKMNMNGVDHPFRIMTIVRNPYNRVISDLFFNGFLSYKIKPTEQQVYEKLNLYLNYNSDFDNHKIPQFHYLVDENGKMIKNIHIMKMETLTKDMHRYGYVDFDCRSNVTNLMFNMSSTNYISLLNDKSISLINEYYKEDFQHLGYDVLNVTKPVQEIAPIVPEKNTNPQLTLSPITFGISNNQIINSDDDLVKAFASLYTGIPIHKIPNKPNIPIPRL